MNIYIYDISPLFFEKVRPGLFLSFEFGDYVREIKININKNKNKASAPVNDGIKEGC